MSARNGTGDILFTTGASDTTKATLTNAGNFTITGDITIQGGDLLTNQTTFNLLNTTATTINFGGGATTALNIGPGGATATSINLAGGSGATGCTIDGATGNLTCSGAITTTATTGTQGWWSRSSTNLSPATTGDSVRVTNAGGERLALQSDVGGVYLEALPSSATDWVISSKVSGNANPQFTLKSNGLMEWGDGTAVQDTNLYRSAADTLRTGDALIVDGLLTGSAGATISGAAINLNNATIATNATTLALFNTTATTLNFAGAASTLNIGPGGATATSINLAGGSGATGCTVNGVNGNLTCSGAISTTATTGQQGWWTRAGTMLQPVNSGDDISTSGEIFAGNEIGVDDDGIFSWAKMGSLLLYKEQTMVWVAICSSRLTEHHGWLQEVAPLISRMVLP